MNNEKIGNNDDRDIESQSGSRTNTGSGTDDDLKNPLTGETRRSEEQIEKDLDDLEEGGGFPADGAQPFSG